MDTYEFLVELNNYLGFKITGPNTVAGDFGGIYYDISVVPDVYLRVHSRIRLFGDEPYKDHIKSAFEELRFFKKYSLTNDNIELLIEPVTLSEDTAFSITEDLTSFSRSLTALGYKSVTDKANAFFTQQEVQEQTSGQAAPQPAAAEDKTPQVLPKNMWKGIIGALIGTVASVLIWFLLAMVNSMMPFILGLLLVVTVPAVLYELFSKEKTSAVQIGICLFLSLLGIFVGEKFIWTYTLLTWYSDVTFKQAYYAVSYLVDEGIVDAFDYYKDYICAFAALAIMYFVIIRNYLTGGLTVRELLSARKKR